MNILCGENDMETDFNLNHSIVVWCNVLSRLEVGTLGARPASTLGTVGFTVGAVGTFGTDGTILNTGNSWKAPTVGTVGTAGRWYIYGTVGLKNTRQWEQLEVGSGFRWKKRLTHSH